jgi:hypothetical protein
MSDLTTRPRQGGSIDDAMVEAMEQRRLQRQERRQTGSMPPAIDRRKTCGYCFQQGDHASPAACLRALER